MADDTEAGMIQAWLDEHEDRKVCSLMLFKEALDNPYVKPKKAETDRICEIMNTSIVGWKQGTMTRFKDYGTTSLLPPTPDQYTVWIPSHFRGYEPPSLPGSSEPERIFDFRYGQTAGIA